MTVVPKVFTLCHFGPLFTNFLNFIPTVFNQSQSSPYCNYKITITSPKNSKKNKNPSWQKSLLKVSNITNQKQLRKVRLRIATSINWKLANSRSLHQVQVTFQTFGYCSYFQKHSWPKIKEIRNKTIQKTPESDPRPISKTKAEVYA